MDWLGIPGNPPMYSEHRFIAVGAFAPNGEARVIVGIPGGYLGTDAEATGGMAAYLLSDGTYCGVDSIVVPAP